MWKLIKLTIFSIIFLILLFPTWMFGGLSYNQMTGKWLPSELQPYEHLIVDGQNSFYNGGDDVKVLKQYCIDNDNFGASSTDDCIEDEIKFLGASSIIYSVSVVIFLIFGVIFGIYSIFYARWLRRNYFKKKTL